MIRVVGNVVPAANLRGGDPLFQFPVEGFAVRRNLNPLPRPSGKVNRVGKLQRPQAVLRLGDQRLPAQQVRREGVDHPRVLRVLSVCRQRLRRNLFPVPRIVALKADLPLVHAHPPNADRPVFADDLPPFAVDLKPVRPRQVPRGGHENPRRPVREFKRRRHVVFNLNPVPFSLPAFRGHCVRHPAKPDQQVQLVRALVQQHPAAFPFPGRPPAPAVVVSLRPVPVRDDPVHPLDGAHLAPGQQRLHRPVDAVRPLVKHEGQRLPRPLGHPDHVLRPVCLHGRRLFAKHVQPRFQGRHRQGFVRKMRNGNQHRVAAAGGDQLQTVPENRNPVRKILPCPVPPRSAQIRHGAKRNLRTSPVQNHPAVLAAHVPDPDNPQPNQTVTRSHHKCKPQKP